MDSSPKYVQPNRTQQARQIKLSMVGFFILGIVIPVALIFFFFGEGMQDGSAPSGLSIFLGSVLPLGCFISAFVLVFRTNARIAAQTFDYLFLPLGLVGRKYLSGREYHGVVNGRQVDIYLTPEARRNILQTPGGRTVAMTRYAGHVLEMYVSAKTQGRFSISSLSPSTDPGIRFVQIQLKRAVGKLEAQAKLETVNVADPEFSGLSAVSLDVPWAQELVANKQMKTGLLTLLGVRVQAQAVSAQVQPNYVKFYFHGHKKLLTPDTVKEWMGALMGLANGAEEVATPTITAQESQWELWSRTDRSHFNKYGWLIMVVIIGVPIMIIALVAWANWPK